jgi:hypothetical protein
MTIVTGCSLSTKIDSPVSTVRWKIGTTSTAVSMVARHMGMSAISITTMGTNAKFLSVTMLS